MTEFSYGIECLLNTPSLVQSLRTHRVGLVAHPASLTQDMTHTLDALIAVGITPLRVFGPQHGVRGDKQDNMVESPDFIDPVHQIPVISLYGHHRRPTKEMIEDLDIIIFDLQDLGCRIYTYISTLHYFLEAAGPTGTAIWVLDRPNPAGRGVDGLRLEPGEESFVGVASIARHKGAEPCRRGLGNADARSGGGDARRPQRPGGACRRSGLGRKRLARFHALLPDRTSVG